MKIEAIGKTYKVKTRVFHLGTYALKQDDEVKLINQTSANTVILDNFYFIEPIEVSLEDFKIHTDYNETLGN